MKFLILNGPNVNLQRYSEPGMPGELDYNGMMDYVQSGCDQMGIETDVCQTNHEGDLIDEIQAAAGPQRPQHEPGTRTAKDARRNRRVEVILNRDLKRDKFTDDRGRKASVQAVEEKLAPDLEPRHEEQRYIDQQVPDRGRKQPGRIPAEQTGTENPPGKEAVMRSHSLRAERKENSADSQQEQVPQHGLSELVSLRQTDFHENSVWIRRDGPY